MLQICIRQLSFFLSLHLNIIHVIYHNPSHIKCYIMTKSLSSHNMALPHSIIFCIIRAILLNLSIQNVIIPLILPPNISVTFILMSARLFNNATLLNLVMKLILGYYSKFSLHHYHDNIKVDKHCIHIVSMFIINLSHTSHRFPLIRLYVIIST